MKSKSFTETQQFVAKIMKHIFIFPELALITYKTKLEKHQSRITLSVIISGKGLDHYGIRKSSFNVSIMKQDEQIKFKTSELNVSGVEGSSFSKSFVFRLNMEEGLEMHISATFIYCEKYEFEYYKAKEAIK